MFQSLSNKIQGAFRYLTGKSVLTEKNIREAMETIRTALLDADVNYQVAVDFTDDCAKACLGEAVLRNVEPGQQAVKIVYDKLTALLGAEDAPLALEEGDPAVIMLCGLHGSGKTTTSAKLAKYIREKHHKKVMLAACDLARPAAIAQLSALGADLGVQVFADTTTQDVPKVATAAVQKARDEGMDVVILDTAGRLQIDETLVKELIEVKKRTSPQEILLVADAALGQQAVSVAEHFHQALGITGVILTKLDGDARGGAALSIHQVTQRPIKFVAVGERPQDLEMFHPDRMASRILGMGDILSLYEKAAEEIKEEEAKELEEKLRKNNFGLDDFLTQMQRMKRLGGLMGLLKMLPGMGNISDQMAQVGEKEMKKVEVMIQSMTPAERRNPAIIGQSRRMRIAKGSHSTLQDVNALMKRFQMMRDMVEKMNRSGGLGSMLGNMGGMGAGGGLGSLFGGGEGANPMGGTGMGGGMGNMGNMGNFGGYQSPRMNTSQGAHASKEQQKRLEKKKQAKAARKRNRH